MATNKAAKRTALTVGVSAAIGAVALGVVGVATTASPTATIPARHSQVSNQTEVGQGRLAPADLLIPTAQRGAQDNRTRLVPASLLIPTAQRGAQDNRVRLV